MFKKGQNVQQEFGGQVMKVIGFEPELIENVLTQWEDEQGTIVTAKFMESQLLLVDEKRNSDKLFKQN
ncbi:hypothetical protein [Flavobacterium aquidurense]|uniref:hypothetical protein n=1 Tax=Flavobacterium aquidurense TaxID=362413 RepID=UPI002857E0E1|nr:hypothetical protein [Flavobacterium aquidurense]MDR7370217.1 hypothetical protein [Flavobacterium aquidurense]